MKSTYLSQMEIISLCLILIASILLVLYFHFSQKKTPPLPSKFLTIASDLVQIKCIRYANPQKTPIILIHGYTSNSHSWREMGHFLFTEGYDIWGASKKREWGYSAGENEPVGSNRRPKTILSFWGGRIGRPRIWESPIHIRKLEFDGYWE